MNTNRVDPTSPTSETELSIPPEQTHKNPPKKDKKTSIDLNNPKLYINRELSWLEFNQRVLEQIHDDKHPLLERVKFLAIVGTNLDEFFMIRVATILKKLKSGIEGITMDGLSAQQQYRLIRKRTEKMHRDMRKGWNILRPLLSDQGIKFLEIHEYSETLKKYLHEYFMKEIHPVLTPMAFDPGHPFPHISSLSMNFAVVVHHNDDTKFARVKIPDTLSRFIQVPKNTTKHRGQVFVFLEDIIRCNIAELFPGTTIEEVQQFRITRDTDLVIQEDEADDLMESIDEGLKQIRYGDVSLLQVEKDMSQRTMKVLAKNSCVNQDVISFVDDRMSFGDWMELMKLSMPQIKDHNFVAPVLFEMQQEDMIFERMKYKDYLVHHPYESFLSVETFLHAAMRDPKVVAIKITLYRVGQNSRIVEKLIEAAENGKQVTVLVELKARFDEQNNVVWARRLESVGAHVVYGMLHLKTHCKLCLAVRQETSGIRRYMHIGTGNYNPSTSKIYTDLGLFTSNQKIGEDASQVFNFLTGYSSKMKLNHLLMAPVSIRSGLEELIEREKEHAKAGRPSRLIFKVNSIADPEMIRVLYQASQAEVPIDLIVRGVCCLRPGMPDVSETIRVFSIIGRFLEHSRIYYFENGGSPEMYIGSADLMERNLDRRVEVLTPVLDEEIKQHLKNVVLDSLLSDNVQKFELNSNGQYKRIVSQNEETHASQLHLLNLYSENKREM